MPLGMFLRRKLRVEMGKSPKAPDHVLAALEEGVQPLRSIAFDTSQSITKAYQELFQGEFDKVNFRHTINKRKEKL